MIIKIKISTLIESMKKLSTFIEEKKRSSIFSCILIKKIKNDILYTVLSDEMEVSIINDYIINDQKDFEIIIKFNLLYDLCKRNKKEDYILIKKNKASIEIKIKNLYITLPIVLEIFPKFDLDISIANTKLNSVLFKNIIMNTINILNKNTLNLTFSGIFVEINKNIITSIAIDDFRFVYAYEYSDIINEKNISILLSKDIIKHIIKFITEKTEYIYITITKNFIKIIIDNISIITKMINENFDFPTLNLSDDVSEAIVVKKNKIKNLINKIALIAKSRSIYFFFNKKFVKIVARNRKERAYISFKKYNFIKQPFRISVKYEYFSDIIKTISNDNIKISFSQKKNYIIIKGIDDNHIHVLTHKQ